MLLTNTRVSKIRKALANVLSSSINLAKTLLHKIGQSRGHLGRLLGPLFKTNCPW